VLQWQSCTRAPAAAPTTTPGPTPSPTDTPEPGACTPVGGLLLNPDFEDAKPTWNFFITGQGSWTAGGPAANCANAAKVSLSIVNSNVQLNQTGATLQASVNYRLRLEARSNDGRDLRVQVFRESNPSKKFVNAQAHPGTSSMLFVLHPLPPPSNWCYNKLLSSAPVSVL
jgi:hypothetical protein